MSYDFHKKVVILTGGGRGLGVGIARAFSRCGATLVITGRTEAPLLKTRDQLMKEFHNEVLAIVADGSREETVQSVVQRVIEQYGRIDVLINNAQAGIHGLPLEEQTKDTFDLAFHTGVYATYYYMKACFPYLKESHGSIINFGSGAGISGMSGFGSYATNKEAIRGLTRVAATEWSKYGINSNVICPSVASDALLEWAKTHQEEYKQVLSTTPTGQFCDAETDIGGTCLFLASPAAKQITGRTFDVDGGQNQRP